MIYFIVIIYFLSGLGVALALDDPRDERSRALLWFFATIALWPLAFTFTLTLAAKQIAESNPASKQVNLTTNKSY